MITKQQALWVRDSLANDETSTDEELTNFFIDEYGISPADAKSIIETREKWFVWVPINPEPELPVTVNN